MSLFKGLRSLNRRSDDTFDSARIPLHPRPPGAITSGIVDGWTTDLISNIPVMKRVKQAMFGSRHLDQNLSNTGLEFCIKSEEGMVIHTLKQTAALSKSPHNARSFAVRLCE
jgi:hypothetical protein